MKYQLSAVVVVALVALTGCGDSSTPQPAKPSVIEQPAAQPNSTVVETAPGGEQVFELATSADAADSVGTDAGPKVAAVIGGIDLAAGEAIYNRTCLSCHAAGIANAPKLGAVEDWAPRAAKGLEALVQASIKGVPPAMPAKGLCFDCSEADMRNVVSFMLSKLE